MYIVISHTLGFHMDVMFRSKVIELNEMESAVKIKEHFQNAKVCLCPEDTISMTHWCARSTGTDLLKALCTHLLVDPIILHLNKISTSLERFQSYKLNNRSTNCINYYQNQGLQHTIHDAVLDTLYPE